MIFSSHTTTRAPARYCSPGSDQSYRTLSPQIAEIDAKWLKLLSFAASPVARAVIITTPRKAGASVNKHLVCLLMICAVIAGCRPKNPATKASPVAGLPPGSFTRQWTQPLDLKNNPPLELHLTKDYVFAYTRDHVAYTI